MIFRAVFCVVYNNRFPDSTKPSGIINNCGYISLFVFYNFHDLFDFFVLFVIVLVIFGFVLFVIFIFFDYLFNDLDVLYLLFFLLGDIDLVLGARL